MLDLFARRVVGWAMETHLHSDLVERALAMARQQRLPDPSLLFHSDRGGQYQARSFQQQLRDAEMVVSMSRKGNCWDNAPVESFFGTLKTECADRVFASRAEARSAIFDYIETWYNRQRLHSSNAYLSPLAREAAFFQATHDYDNGCLNGARQTTTTTLALSI